MPGITREDVIHLAQRSQLDLRSDELDRFTDQLNAIIGMVSRVAVVTTNGTTQCDGEQ